MFRLISDTPFGVSRERTVALLYDRLRRSSAALADEVSQFCRLLARA